MMFFFCIFRKREKKCIVERGLDFKNNNFDDFFVSKF